MIQDCKFNPLCDVEETVPELAPDISEMMLTHTVPATSSVDTPYTNETDIHEVGHYLRDKIDVAMAQLRLSASLSAMAEKDSKAAKTAQAASAGVQSTAQAGASA